MLFPPLRARKGDVLMHRALHQQVIALEDKGHMAAAMQSKAGFPNVLALIEDLPAVRTVQTAQKREGESG